MKTTSASQNFRKSVQACHSEPIEKSLPLPKGWKLVRLDEVCEIIQGQSPPGDTYNTTADGLPFFQGKAEFGGLYPIAVKWCTKPKKIAQRDDVLISVRAPVGPTNLCPYKACIGRGLAALRPLEEIPPKYILYAIRTTVNDLVAKATGSTFEAINGKDLKAHQISLAPIPVQREIVAEIEKQFTRLEAGVAALKRVAANLKRYRASVLKAACEGKLVPTEAELARAKGRSYEPAEVLLQRILKERREKWTGKGRYKDPGAPDTTNLSKLPRGWCWATVDQLASFEPNSITDGPFGSNLKTSHYTNLGPRVIRLQNIGDGEFIDADAHISQSHFEKLIKHKVYAGDLVIAALGEIPPKACIIPLSVGQAIVKADCIRFHPHSSLALPKYLNCALNSEPTRNRTAKIVHGVGRPRLNLSEIKSIALPLPPFYEQQRIVAEVERRLSFMEELEKVIEANLIRAERLRQSVLQYAFSGRLISPDFSDKPACDLLEQLDKKNLKASQKKSNIEEEKHDSKKSEG